MVVGSGTGGTLSRAGAASSAQEILTRMGAPEVVRSHPGRLKRSTASLDYRLAVRFPRIRGLVMRWINSMPPTARVRRIALPRLAQLAYAAFERGEYRTTTETAYAPDVEFEAGELRGVVPIDLPLAVSGREEVARWVAGWSEAFAWLTYEVTEFLDFGDAIVFAVNMEGAGKTSGVVTNQQLFSALRFERGQVTWQRFFPARDDAIRAVGRDPSRVPVG
jgi:hypothetical protein